MLGHWINIYNLCYHYCCFVVLFYHKLVKLLKIALLGHYLGKHWTSMGHAKMKLNFFFLALNKLLQMTYHCCSTHRYSEAWSNESKMQNWNVTWCIKLVFSKLALLQRVWQKKNFSQNWREEWNKEIHCSKNIHCLKLKLYHFLN